MWHPKGAYVTIGAHRVNQYKVRLFVDLWNIEYDVHYLASEAFTSRYVAYLDWLKFKERKGMGKSFNFSVGGTYHSVIVMNEEADQWLRQLWELCSGNDNLCKIHE